MCVCVCARAHTHTHNSFIDFSISAGKLLWGNGADRAIGALHTTSGAFSLSCALATSITP